MTWNCPKCGTENSAERGICLACNHVRASRVTLTADATGKSIAMTLDTPIGKASLRPLGDPDYIYASEPQFHILRDPVAGHWLVLPDGAAKNPTCLDGRALSSREELRNGTVISVGPARLKLKVAIQFT